MADSPLIPTTDAERAMFTAGAEAAKFQIAFVIADWQNRPAPTGKEWPKMVALIVDYIKTMVI